MKTPDILRRTRLSLVKVIAGLAITAALSTQARAQDIDHGYFKKNLPGTMWYEFKEVNSAGVPRGLVYYFAPKDSGNPAVPKLFGSGLEPYTGYLALLEGSKFTVISEFIYGAWGDDIQLYLVRQKMTFTWAKTTYDWQNGKLVFTDWSQIPWGTPWQESYKYARNITWYNVNSQVFSQYFYPLHFPN